MKHLLKLETLPRADFETILRAAAVFKRERAQPARQPLAGQTWALMFSKQSTRTRLSFEVGIRELGGMPMFLSAVDIQLGRGEPIKDTARVMGRMVHGAVIGHGFAAIEGTKRRAVGAPSWCHAPLASTCDSGRTKPMWPPSAR